MGGGVAEAEARSSLSPAREAPAPTFLYFPTGRPAERGADGRWRRRTSLTSSGDPDSIHAGPGWGGWRRRGAGGAEGGDATWAGAGGLGPGAAGDWGLGAGDWGLEFLILLPPLHGWGLRSDCSPRGRSCAALCLWLRSTSVLAVAHISPAASTLASALGRRGAEGSLLLPSVSVN